MPASKPRTTEADSNPQLKKFVESAREVEADEDEEAFKRVLKRVAEPKPEKKK